MITVIWGGLLPIDSNLRTLYVCMYLFRMSRKLFMIMKIHISGIPVSPVFRSHPEKHQARQELHIPQNKKVYLIMTGGIGCENMHSLCQGMLEKLDENSLMIVLVGKNQELKMKLDARYGGDSRMRTVSFTKQVAEYMAASDVLLSKPGGLSSTEAAVANIPLVHIHAIPGCETYNARFFSSHGMSVAAETEAEAIRSAIALANDPEAAQRMRQNQRT